MNRTGKYLRPLVLLFFILCVTVKQSVGQTRLSATIDKHVVQDGELIELRFSVESATEIGQFNPPSFKGCRVVEGPIRSGGIFVVDGPVSHYANFKYVLQPDVPGNHEISGGSIQINGQRFRFNSVRFTVTIVGQGTTLNNFAEHRGIPVLEQDLYSDYIVRKGEDIEKKIQENLFIRVEVNKNHCYAGEPLVATYKLYSRLCSDSKVSRRPSFYGFSVYDIVDPASVAPTVENLNGKLFNVHLIRKVQVYPLHSGTLQLDPAEVENSIIFLSAQNSLKVNEERLSALLRSPGALSASQRDVVTKNVSIRNSPVSITVLPLPDSNRPQTFDGAVGSFGIEAAIDSNQIALNDVAKVEIVIKGEGNFDMINAPHISWPTEVETFDPDIKTDLLRNEVPMRGYKVFTFAIMPRRTGRLMIPPVEFSFFDPQTGQYKTEKTRAIIFNATSEEQPASMPISTSLVREERGELGTKQVWWIGIIVFLVMSAMFGLWYFKIRSGRKLRIEDTGKNRTNEMTGEREELYSRFQSSPLFRVRLMLIQHNGEGFYAELGRVLWSQMTEKLKLPAAYNDRRGIADRMKEKGLDEITISQFQLLIQQCDMALYTPVVNVEEMQSVYELAEDLIENISKV